MAEHHEFYLLLLGILAVFFFIAGMEFIFYFLLAIIGLAVFVFIAYDVILRPREV